ncbi:MAG: hypothetical protein ABR566_17725 [Pyrinomonadaceae bacterium]
MKIHKPIFLITALLFFSVNAYSFYRCIKPGTASQELKRAAVVFSGKVIEKEYLKITDPSDNDFGGERLTIKIKVDKLWKGSIDNEIVLHTSEVKFPNGITSFMSEDFSFASGESYLIYAFYYKNAFRTNGCTRTKLLSEAEEDLKELGEGYLPKKLPLKNKSQMPAMF